MARIIVGRLLWLPAVLLLITLTVFILGTYGPGDPARVRLGPRATNEQVERMREQMGLNRSLPEQYVSYVINAVQGEFGDSYKHRIPVVDLLAPRMLISMQLALPTLLLSIPLGLFLGVYAATQQGTWRDRGLITVLLAPEAIPIFIFGPMAIWLFSYKMKWVPAAGWDGIFSDKAILPIACITIVSLAGLVRRMRTSVLDTMFADYVRTARAKGLSSRQVLWRHVVRNAFLPIWTSFGGLLAALPAGSIVTEAIFGIPGVGQLAFSSVLERDYPVVMATILLGAALYVIGNLLVDLGYPYIDPRIREA